MDYSSNTRINFIILILLVVTIQIFLIRFVVIDLRGDIDALRQEHIKNENLNKKERK